MTLPNATNLFWSNRRRGPPVYALIETEVRETLPVDLAPTLDDMCGIISCLRQAPVNGRRLHLDTVVDVSTCLRPCRQRATCHRRYKHEHAERVVRRFHRGSLASVRVRIAHQIIRAGEKRSFRQLCLPGVEADQLPNPVKCQAQPSHYFSMDYAWRTSYIPTAILDTEAKTPVDTGVLSFRPVTHLERRFYL
jgi:hypothetical protein